MSKLHNPWWCSLLLLHSSGRFVAWWHVCDYFGISISHGVSGSYWPKSHPEEEYLLVDVSLLGWRIEILRPDRYRRFPWERCAHG